MRAHQHLLRFGCDFATFVPARAEGSWLYDARGARMLDFTSGQMSAILGHSHPEVVATIRDAAGTLDTDAYLQMLVDRPGYREFQDRKWADTSVVMWSTLAVVCRRPSTCVRPSAPMS